MPYSIVDLSATYVVDEVITLVAYCGFHFLKWTCYSSYFPRNLDHLGANPMGFSQECSKKAC